MPGKGEAEEVLLVEGICPELAFAQRSGRGEGGAYARLASGTAWGQDHAKEGPGGGLCAAGAAHMPGRCSLGFM